MPIVAALFFSRADIFPFFKSLLSFFFRSFSLFFLFEASLHRSELLGLANMQSLNDVQIDKDDREKDRILS